MAIEGIERFRRLHRDLGEDGDPIPTEELSQKLGDIPRTEDKRSRAETDRDRLLYSSALRRLAGVTQVVSPSEGRVFHNRLTHSLKVAQVGRRLAERLLGEEGGGDRAALWGGLDPAVVEAAGLAHDLGHPPFGHVAEDHLKQILRERVKLPDSFEGNPQSFRIVTRLAAHRRHYRGLDLCRATLNAMLKYPWLRSDDVHKSEKFGCYSDDKASFDFARDGMEEGRRSLEAEIMDFADDITYSIHDFEDFCRAQLIPLDRLLHTGTSDVGIEEGESQAKATRRDLLFPPQLKRVIDEWKTEQAAKKAGGLPHTDPERIDHLRTAFKNVLQSMHIPEGYRGSHQDRAHYRVTTSRLIDKFASSPEISDDPKSDHALVLDQDQRAILKFLQSLVFRYVINDPGLATQQAAQRQIIETLWEVYFEVLGGETASGRWQGGLREDMIPPSFWDDAEPLQDNEKTAEGKAKYAARLAVDIVCSFTDQEALAMYQRLSGISLGSVQDSLFY